MLRLMLLGTTNVSFFTAGSRVELPGPGILGAMEDIANLAGVGQEADALFVTDVSVREGHRRSSKITRHPVEVASPEWGPQPPTSDVTDHVSLDPKILTIEGMQTDTPSGLGALLIVPALIEEFTQMPRRIQAFDTLEELWETKAIMDVLTSITVYRNMVISNYSAPRDSKSSRSLRFSLVLEEINLVGGAVVAGAATTPDGAGGFATIGEAFLR